MDNKDYYTVGKDVLAISGKPEKPKITRRDLLKVGAGLLALVGANKFPKLNHQQPPQPSVDTSNSSPSQPTEHQPLPLAILATTTATAPTPTPSPIPATPGPEQTVPEKPNPLLTSKEILSNILKAPLNSEERLQEEYKYVVFTKELQDLPPEEKLKVVDQGFWGIVSSELRAQLLDERYQLRKDNCPGLSPLPKHLLLLCAELKIHPEVMGVCVDGYHLTLDLINKLKVQKGEEFFQFFRPDLVYKHQIGDISPETLKQISPEDLLINMLGMAEIVSTETQYTPDKGILFTIVDKFRGRKNFSLNYLFPDFRYGFCNIGRVPAIKQLKGIYENSKPELVKVVELLKQNLHLNFVPENIAGSEAGEGDESGGAIGLQLMPDRILEIYNFLEENFGLKFNPFDLLSSVVGAYIFLARGEKVEEDQAGNPLFRYGFLNGSYMIEKSGEMVDLFKAIRKAALGKWNQHTTQIEQILKGAKALENAHQLAQIK